MAYTPTTWVESVTKLGPTNMNHLEGGVQATAVVADAAIPKPSTPGASSALVWNGSSWVAATLVNANVDAAAAIAYSKLNLAGGIVNNDVAAGAAILASKLAAYPSDATKFLSGAGTWLAVAPVTYRKTTAKVVNTTVAATDLLNAEITVAAAAMGATGLLRFKAWGDYLNNSGGATAQPRFQLLFGGTTFFDSGTTASAIAADATRRPWEIEVLIQNATASSQTAKFLGHLVASISSGIVNAFTTGTGFWAEGSGASPVAATGQAVNSGLTVNTANAAALVLNVINGSANAAYETKLFGAVVEIIV